jgi:hypothetical protein
MRFSDEQLIFIDRSEPFQGVGNGWLRQPHVESDLRGLPVFHQPQENENQGRIEKPDINVIYISHDCFSLV